jgi:hypothetical protein
MSGAEEPEGFLSRWSRRKRAAAESAPAEPASPAAEAPPTDEPPEAAPGCPIPNLPEIDLASLPRIEELTAESDFALFLRPGVPAALRSAALRRMWSLDPAIRDFIGPVDYQWDFNTPGGLPPGFAGELVGDVKKLLAQAIGQPDPEEAPPAAPEVAPRPGAEETEEPPAALVEAPVAEAAPPLPAPEPPAPADLAAEAPQRRRHGSALPS